MEKIKHHINYAILFLFIGIFVTILIQIGYAQTNPENNVIAPEPGSLILLSTGITGWMLRFARKRFKEFKRFFDILVGAAGLVIASPVILFTVILIKIVSPGPVFYRQQRVGLDGKLFNIYKIRTMRLDAEKTTGPVWAKEDDPRLIKFGKVIRKSH
ncbi:MAG: sugar transferase, partial [Candidatus Omnitrophica bacterium]|nr:sugar transferase [Candidatus Omnitrophota bacterium]